MLNVLALVASFTVGIMVMMAMVPKPKVVVRFPTPESEAYVYHGASGDCFRINAEEEDCPADRKNVRSQPVGDESDFKG
jgi:hypothetical protein